MKTKLNTADKEHRAAWRLAAYAATKPATVSVRHKHTPKALRLPETHVPKVHAPNATKDLRTMIADLFHGTTYKGPYVHITHKQAFEARQAKRTAALAKASEAKA